MVANPKLNLHPSTPYCGVTHHKTYHLAEYFHGGNHVPQGPVCPLVLPVQVVIHSFSQTVVQLIAVLIKGEQQADVQCPRAGGWEGQATALELSTGGRGGDGGGGGNGV